MVDICLSVDDGKDQRTTGKLIVYIVHLFKSTDDNYSLFQYVIYNKVEGHLSLIVSSSSVYQLNCDSVTYILHHHLNHNRNKYATKRITISLFNMPNE